MKLISAQIFEFQSVRNSNPFDVGEITCLVGKNEAGKTALLRALYRLNPLVTSEGKFDVTDDYPRSDVEDYQQDIEAGRQKPATVVVANFEISQEELGEIEGEFKKGILQKSELTLSKGYDNELRKSLPISDKILLESIINKAQLPNELTNQLKKAANVDELSQMLKSQNEDESKDHLDRLNTVLTKYEESGGVTQYIFENFLEQSLPKFMYFDEYTMMKGSENIEALRLRQQQNKLLPQDYPLLGLIELARLDLNGILNHKRTEELVNKLEGAGNHLSKKVLKYWSQNKHLSMKFDVRPGRPEDPPELRSGTNIWARVQDSKREVSTLLGTRSRGFVWFFSFLAWFDQQQRKNEPLILLLDEPGLYLHGRAQADLLDYMEKELRGNHQVIYTTHSPFMVDPNKFDRVRIVQDKSMDIDEELPKDQDGTKVITEVLDATEDSLFPLQGALGYDIYQTLFVGPNCLVVEGVSDLIYLQTISSILDSLGKEKLDERWTITPVGGAEKVPTFVALLGSQKGLKIATLIDIHSDNRQSIDNLYKRKLLKKKNVLTFADFTDTSEADMEDMFDEDLYLDLVSKEYSSELKKPVSTKSLDANLPRVLQRLESHFAKNPLKSGNQFSHYRPARYFAEHTGELTQDISQDALARFERAFRSLNSLL